MANSDIVAFALVYVDFICKLAVNRFTRLFKCLIRFGTCPEMSNPSKGSWYWLVITAIQVTNKHGCGDIALIAPINKLSETLHEKVDENRGTELAGRRIGEWVLIMKDQYELFDLEQ